MDCVEIRCLPGWWMQISSFLLTLIVGFVDDDSSPLGEEFGVLVVVYSEPQFRHRVVGIEVGLFRFLEGWESGSKAGLLSLLLMLLLGLLLLDLLLLDLLLLLLLLLPALVSNEKATEDGSCKDTLPNDGEASSGQDGLHETSPEDGQETVS